MPILQDFTLAAYDDSTITISLVPGQPVGGWGVTFQVAKHQFGSAMVTASIVSGIANGASGLTVLNSGLGWFQVNLFTSGAASISGSSVSGLSPGNYAYRFSRTDSGYAGVLAEGVLTMTP